MSLEIVKPEPLLVDGRYRYSLSSYEPVSVTVPTMSVTEREISLAIDGLASAEGLSADEIDDAWVQAHTKGIESVGALRESIRSELALMSQRSSQERASILCVSELTKRLEQSLPREEVEPYFEDVQASLAHELARQGLTLDQFIANSGMTRADYEGLLFEQARSIAEEAAALDAYVDAKKVAVDETEIPSLLSLSPADASKLIQQAKADGALDLLLANAARVKAANQIVAEANCSYEEESEEDANKRVDALEAMMAADAARRQQGHSCGCGGHGHGHGGGGCGCGGHDHGADHGHGEDCGCGGHGHAHEHGEGCCAGHGHDEGCGCTD